MLDIESLAVDPKAAEDGVWADFMGARFKIARHNSDRCNQLRAKLTLENWDQIAAGDEAADKVAQEINAKVVAQAVLLDWEKVQKAGKDLPYTAELGYEYLSNPRFRDLLQFVENFSMNRGNYRERAITEAAEQVKPTAAS